METATIFAQCFSDAPPALNVIRKHRIVIVGLDGTVESIILPNTAAPHLRGDCEINISVWEHVDDGDKERVETWLNTFVQEDHIGFAQHYFRKTQGREVRVNIAGALTFIDDTFGDPVRVILTEYLLLEMNDAHR